MNAGCSLPVGDEDGDEDVWYAVWAWVSNRGRARWVWTAVVLWVGSECGNEYRDAAVAREAGASVDDLVRSSTTDRTDEREVQRLARMAMLLLPLPCISVMNGCRKQ